MDKKHKTFSCIPESKLPKKFALFAGLKALFVLKIFKFLSQLFGQVQKMALLER